MLQESRLDGASNALIHNCSISGNHYAKGGRTDCGGIMIYDNSSVEIINSTITDNEGNAGGIYIWPDLCIIEEQQYLGKLCIR